MTLECGNGKVFQNIDASTLSTELDKLEGDNFFATLNSDSGFIQAAVTTAGFLAEYRDSGGYFRSREENIPLADIKKAFLSYLEGKDDWKTLCTWEKEMEDDTAEPGYTRKTGGIPRPESLVDGLVNSVKKDLKNAAKRKLGKFLKF